MYRTAFPPPLIPLPFLEKNGLVSGVGVETGILKVSNFWLIGLSVHVQKVDLGVEDLSNLFFPKKGSCKPSKFRTFQNPT